MTEFVDDLQSTLQRAKSEWTAKLDDFTSRLSSNDHGLRVPNPLSPLTPFRVLLQLFAYKDVWENGKLEYVYDMDDGAGIIFYVPQLLSFLLHGALYCSPQLEEWILDKCRRNIHFAHRCYWFLRAWCLEAPMESSPTPMLSRQNSGNNLSIQGLSPFLDEPATPQRLASRSPLDCGPRIAAFGIDRNQTSRAFRSTEKFFPEERAMIERLMMRIKECGEEPARQLEFGTGEPDDDTQGQNHASFIENHDTSNSATQHTAESSLVPVHPITSYPSTKHIETLSAPRKFGFLSFDEVLTNINVSKSTREGATDYFDKTPQFLDALIFVAENLFSVPREQRKEELTKQLQLLECELLPSNSIYLPVNNTNHRVWRIAAEESVAISTKERVPCIICMEVIDYNVKRRRARQRNIFEQLRLRSTGNNEDFPETQPSIPLPSTFNREISTESVETVPMRNGNRDADTKEASEAALVNEWRFARRDPHRRTSFFDKVTTTVQNTVKVPLNKVKSQVRDKFNHFRDRTVSDELRSLTMSEGLVDNQQTNLNGRAEWAERVDIESAPSEEMDADAVTLQQASRSNSSASLVSMGQWSSPPKNNKDREQTNASNSKDSSATNGLRRRLDLDDLHGSVSGSSLPYGSDEERETSPSKTRRLKEETPDEDKATKLKSKRPLVVFRESWQSKEDRVRKRSAYGQHPGWRLLPVLVKANDDLRQEQLASQIIYRMAAILVREKVPVWLCPYEILAITESGGVIEAIPDTISLDSLKRNDPNYSTLRNFFHKHYGEGTDELADAKASFIESLAAYSIVCFLLQIKDRHNGNILLDNRGHVIHIDFGFFFLSSPGKNAGFESAPFKLTREMVEVMDGPHSRLFRNFRELCIKTYIALRRHCMEVILLVEMLKAGNEELKCFRGRPDEAIQQLRERFRLDLNDRACREYVNALVDDSVENWRTDWYDRYQRYFVGVL